MKEKREKWIKEKQVYFSVKRCQRKLKELFKIRAGTQQQRHQTRLKQALSFLAHSSMQVAEEKTKLVVIDFLKAYSQKFKIKNLILDFHFRVVKMQERFKIFLKRIIQRREIL